MISLISGTNSNLYREKVEWWLPEVRGEEEMGSSVYWVQNSVWDDERALEMDSGDDRTTLQMHCMLLNHTLNHR